MTESEQTKTGKSKTKQSKKRSKQLLVGALLGIMILYAILIIVAIWHPGLHGQRLKFGTENGLTLAIVIAVVAQVIIYRQQWDVMKRGVTQASRLHHLSERPSLGIFQANVRKYPDGTGMAAILIRNFGKSPALKITSDCRFSRVEKKDAPVDVCPDDPPKVDYEVGIKARTMIAAGGMKERLSERYSQTLIKQIEKGDMVLFAYYHATYKSTTGKTYFISWYARFNPTNGGFEECQTHNDAN